MGTSRREILFILVFFLCYKADAACKDGCKENALVNKEIDQQIRSTTSKTVDNGTAVEALKKRRYRRGYIDGAGNGSSFSSPAFSAVRLMRSKLSEFMAADPRIEPNVTWSRQPHETYYGGINTEQKNRKKVDNFKKVLEYRNNPRGVGKVDKGTECDFESECKWTWQRDATDNRFFVTSGGQMGDDESGLRTDGDNNDKGHFLMVRLKPSSSSKETDWNWTITSPMFDPVGDNCRIQFLVFQSHMNDSVIRIVLHNINKTQVMVDQILGTNTRRWTKYEKVLGKSTQKFTVMLEVVPGKNNKSGALVAFDNIKLLRCYPENANSDVCTQNQYRCAANNVCINNSEICDITRDCIDGDDEMQNCDKIPMGARCNFEQDWCGWYNAPGKPMDWTRHNGSTATNATTGPKIDHTYGNVTGKYLHVTVATTVDALFASTATLKSIIFNPPPKVHGNLSSVYYNSCMIRFYLHQKGNHKSAFSLQVTELKPKENTSTELLWSYDNYDDEWRRQVIILPNITHRYFLHFDIRKGIRYVKDIAIDDLSLSPECFGLNIPTSELNGYDYYNPERPTTLEPHKNFVNETYYEVKTCNATGRYGPTQDNCTSAYSGTPVKVKVLRETGLNGVQKWTVPSEGYYTFIVYGASGGKGSGAMGSSRGSMVRAVLDLRKGQEIYMLVGQEGTSACVKSLGNKANSSCKSLTNYKNFTGIRGILTMELEDGGGGGGGGTFVFLRNKMKRPIPLAVAAGGGGLGLGVFVDTGLQHGHGINHSMLGITGRMFGQKSAGAGGGWSPYLGQIARDHESRQGQALLTGGIGGEACYQSTDGRGDGGFGGGGGGCITGGGGGGYSGGNAQFSNATNGQGGFSYVDPNRTLSNFTEAIAGFHSGAGMVIIIPAVPGCDCDYRCLALDPHRSQVACICPTDWKLALNGKNCTLIEATVQYPWFMILLISFIVLLILFICGACFVMYNRYQQRVEEVHRKMLTGPDLQLNRLRVASDSMMTEYNPNYEFGGVVYTLKDLKDIPRDQLRLVKALGQGAFGEVYQGFYRQRSGDTVEVSVAVKTLPEMSTNQAEMDFLMEALIMSKFNHPNIVHFIGVCFDKHPRFIVLELLAGGDLKNFLRESRPKPERSSPLSMKDLILISVDVAKGCKYLEDNRFIHRDIAARNCLLTTKGPGRVVKIADFGMSRDIYRSDYYRKGGKAMLPIKWMPPEAFLDGIFTSKTDVWSFGVLLWEIMSMGYMPYTGCANRDVMQLVTSGGRLESPPHCPGPIYGIMTQCWHPTPEQRPTFKLILERLGYCTQDPQVMNAPLPIFNRPPSQERDATVMRPNTSDDNCLQVPQTDYLIPNHSCLSVNQSNTIGSSSSIDKLLPETLDSWETSFVLPQSKSTQPLLQETDNNPDENAGSIEKLLTVEPQSVIPNNVHSNHNNNVKSETNLKSGISLDAGALVKQSMPNTTKHKTGEVTGNGVLHNGPYSNQNNYTSEISC